jgi:hypothetical protein
MSSKRPWRNFNKSRWRLFKLPYCLLMDHRIQAKKGERQKVSLEADARVDVNNVVRQLGDKRELWMECMRCGILINVKRKVNVIEQPRIRSTK